MERQAKQPDIPTVFVVFGATGDLVFKKIAPALYHLFRKGLLPAHFKVIGFSRQDLSAADFSGRILDSLLAHTDSNTKTCTDFCDLFSYVSGDFDSPADYEKLGKALKAADDAWGMCSNKLFYLAVAPEFLETIFDNLASSGLSAPCGGPDGWSRVIVEKPFGENLETAKALDLKLKTLFKEEQIYRLDHYLGKEMIQNILTFRFANNLFTEEWNARSIERIHIRLLETIGVEGRGGFYDKVGALEDVGQNHLLQMLAFATMDYPGSLEPALVRRKRAELLDALHPMTAEDIRANTYRAQYDGYRNAKGVSPDSQTETYFKIKLGLDHPSFRGVPIVLESGKSLAEAKKGIEIVFRHPVPCLCPPGGHYQNAIEIDLEPAEGIKIRFWSKKPGIEGGLERRSLDFMLHEKSSEHAEEYEKLIHDAIMGDQTLFVGTDEIAASWRFIDPIVSAWKRNAVPLDRYRVGSSEPLAASAFIEAEAPRGELKKEIGMVGLGKMGGNLSRRLFAKGWKIAGFDGMNEAAKKLESEGILESAATPAELAAKLSAPRIVWLMVPAGKPVDEVLFGKNGLASVLQKGDTIIDGGNSFYRDSVKRSKRLAEKGIVFADVGVSGGPDGALHGSALMAGGKRETFERLEPLFADLAAPGGYAFFEGAGAGHFVKMVHNGIEYGMMQAIAEGFSVLAKAKFEIDLAEAAAVYDHGSVIESRLVGWLEKALRIYGEGLEPITGSVAMTGEGEWTLDAAKALAVKAPVIEAAVKFRIASRKKPSFAGKILSVLRNQFGGHAAFLDAKKKKGGIIIRKKK